MTTKPTVKSATDIGRGIEATTLSTVAREMPNRRPTNLLVSGDGVEYKNAIASLLIGSRNAVSTTVTVADRSSAVIAQFEQVEAADAVVNGVIGAAIAASQDPADVDRKLTDQYGNSLRLAHSRRSGPWPAVAAPAAIPTPEAPAPTISRRRQRRVPTS